MKSSPSFENAEGATMGSTPLPLLIRRATIQEQAAFVFGESLTFITTKNNSVEPLAKEGPTESSLGRAGFYAGFGVGSVGGAPDS
jgi:hypothetical protein